MQLQRRASRTSGLCTDVKQSIITSVVFFFELSDNHLLLFVIGPGYRSLMPNPSASEELINVGIPASSFEIIYLRPFRRVLCGRVFEIGKPRFVWTYDLVEIPFPRKCNRKKQQPQNWPNRHEKNYCERRSHKKRHVRRSAGLRRTRHNHRSHVCR